MLKLWVHIPLLFKELNSRRNSEILSIINNTSFLVHSQNVSNFRQIYSSFHPHKTSNGSMAFTHVIRAITNKAVLG
jgi:hypothetical protein